MINATLLLDGRILMLDGLSGSSFSATIVSSTFILIFTIFGLDLFPHWSIATIFTFSSIGEYLCIENLPFLAWIVSPSISMNILLDLSLTVPSRV